jgi:hypothetical protein
MNYQKNILRLFFRLQAAELRDAISVYNMILSNVIFDMSTRVIYGALKAVKKGLKPILLVVYYLKIKQD